MHEQTSGDEEQKVDIADALFLVMSETLTFVDNVKRYPILYRNRINKEKTKKVILLSCSRQLLGR
jgi:hypothetical protein